MHTLKRLLLAVAVLLVFGAFAAFANGQGESANLAGTVSSISPSSGSQVNVVVTTKSGSSYTVTVNQSVVSQAGLQVGQNISLKGLLHKAADGSKSVDATQVQVNGKNYSIDNKGTTSGNGSTSSADKQAEKQAEKEKIHKERADKIHKAEQELEKKDKKEAADSASHDKSSPDTSSNDATTPDTTNG